MFLSVLLCVIVFVLQIILLYFIVFYYSKIFLLIYLSSGLTIFCSDVFLSIIFLLSIKTD